MFGYIFSKIASTDVQIVHDEDHGCYCPYETSVINKYYADE
jgi:hypothetical protein